MRKVTDYDYQLPDELIAQFPSADRSASRLLTLSKSGEISDRNMLDLASEFNSGDLLVTNNTRVIPARVFARKESGGRIEILLERIAGEREVVAQIRASRSPKPGANLIADEDPKAKVSVTGRAGSFFVLNIEVDEPLVSWFRRVGHMPLPPYIERADDAGDQERYQTVFAQHDGAVAAPTAGLHFDSKLLSAIAERGVKRAEVTLHVGAGTYQPVRAENLAEHKMHSEWLNVPQQVVDLVAETQQQGGRIFAVGTTVVRALESAAQRSESGELMPFSGETDIFIYPGFKFNVVDCLLTNFHLPQSTLLMLVSAFCGRQRMLAAYQHAIEQQYRFFSYGDAMLLERIDAESALADS